MVTAVLEFREAVLLELLENMSFLSDKLESHHLNKNLRRLLKGRITDTMMFIALLRQLYNKWSGT